MVLEIGFSHLELGHLRWRRRANFGLVVLHLFKFLLGSSKEKEGKRSGKREEIKVWNSCMEGMKTCLGFCMESLDLLVRKPP